MAVACSAIVGVEDVRLRSDRDGGELTASDVDVPEDGGGSNVTDGSAQVLVQLALGFNHSCARKAAGTVFCWGDNGSGQLGDGVSFEAGTRTPALVPQAVVGVNDALAIASGNAHACIVKKDGAVACWGSNFFGQLGDGTTERRSSPVTVGGVRGATALAGGTSFSCALLATGKVSCWGANYGGQLGDGTKTNRYTADFVQNLEGASAIATGEQHACAIVSGSVRCWGKNTEGQLGNGSVDESLAPTTVSAINDVEQVVAASRFTCARQKGGQVYCWGANTLGQLGTGSPNSAPNPSPAITTVRDAVHIWVGYEHACAARATGDVVCWGSAGDGQVGSGTVPADASIPSPSGVVGLTRANAVSTGGNHSCATTDQGAVYCWGSNSLGQVGNGTKERAYAAVKVGTFP